MTAYDLKPTFTNREEYMAWRKAWKSTYKQISLEVRAKKMATKNAQRAIPDIGTFRRLTETHSNGVALNEAERAEYRLYLDRHSDASHRQQDLVKYRAVARKMMTLLDEAKARAQRIREMHASIKAQMESFPLDLGACKNVDFQYNRASGEFPILPQWTIRTKGKTFYVHEVEANCSWKTHELASGTTRGVIRFPRAKVSFTAEGHAILNQYEEVE